MKKSLFYGCLFLCLFLLWTGLYLVGALEEVDTFIRAFFASLGNPFLYRFATFCSFLASFSFLVPLTVVLLFFLSTIRVKVYFLCNLVISTFLSQLLKYLIHRERALPFFGSLPMDYSYPSGHTMVGICFYSLLLVWITKQVQRKSLRRLGQFLCLFLLLMIPLSRLSLGVHYFSDVVASLFLACSLNSFFLAVFKKEKASHKIAN